MGLPGSRRAACLPDLDFTVAEELLDQAHGVCPYSNAVRGNVEVLTVVDPALEVI
jgi:lipoyl-dependent peroxiredoxin